MNPILEEKITRASYLLAERTRIDTELAEIFGISLAEAQALPNRSGPKCSVCGKTGHNVSTCPEGKGTHPNNPKESRRKPEESFFSKGKKTQRACGVCRKPGHRRENCPDVIATETSIEVGLISDKPEKGGPLSNRDFSNVRQRFGAGIPGGDIADEFECTVEEVDLAVNSRHYMDYIRRRKEKSYNGERV